MTVRLLSGWKDPRTGREYKCSDLLTTDPATETGLVSAKQADTNLSGGNAWVPPASQNTIDASEWLNSTPICIASIGVPFIIPPGDGSANGLQFTGSSGAFTLSAAILTNSWNVLKGCWMYMPASFGGSTYPAGWYWAVFSSDTAGILYTETYVSGRPDPNSIFDESFRMADHHDRRSHGPHRISGPWRGHGQQRQTQNPFALSRQRNGQQDIPGISWGHSDCLCRIGHHQPGPRVPVVVS